ncbi:MAG TPA: hypothetical protein VGH47_04305 [Xanthobacteraceae bacterium]|jgi:hypothetical protein
MFDAATKLKCVERELALRRSISDDDREIAIMQEIADDYRRRIEGKWFDMWAAPFDKPELL